ncbi:hypothetical protein HKX48_004530 [Thoreauomyces humboldtii]|nr:hypothetical protein HKX48_004530 [Thoreauomyces humboldtii]
MDLPTIHTPPREQMDSPQKPDRMDSAGINLDEKKDPPLDEDHEFVPGSPGLEREPTGETIREKGTWLYHHSVLSHIWSTQISVLWLITGIVVTLYGLMYLGSNWDPISRLPNVPVAIVNQDAGYTTLGDLPTGSQAVVGQITQGQPMGATFLSALLGNPQLANRLQWTNATEMYATHDEVVNAVDDGKFWGILYVPSNFSDNFVSSLNVNRTTPVKQTTMSLEFIFDQGRSYTVSNFITAVVTASVGAISSGLATQLANGTASSPGLVNPAFYITPISLASGRRHSVLKFGANLATYITLLLMWLGAMMSVTVIHKLFLAKIPHLTGVRPAKDRIPVHFSEPQILFATLAIASIFSFFHALLAWCVLFGLGGHELFQAASPPFLVFGFLWYFSFSCIGFVSLLSVIFGVDGFAIPASLFLILQMVSCGGILDHVLMPGFLRIGEALPFYWGLRALKAYFFGSQVHYLYKCYAVLAGWWAASTLLAIALGSLKLNKWKKSKILEEGRGALEVLGGTMRGIP